jgi:2-C-methyl-D-erythritol 2,4-cyclodiphosphate synthase
MLSGYRIGFGYDVHQLSQGRKLVLGGILIPSEKGSLAHSDGDVLIHAICDALLGAASLGDIGTHFPDTSSEYKDIDSKLMLDRVLKLIVKEGFDIVNIDSTISLQKPKLKDFIPSMQETLATVLKMDPNSISIKATTTENLGFVGREEGISAQAVVLIREKL